MLILRIGCPPYHLKMSSLKMSNLVEKISANPDPVGNYMFKVNNRKTRARCELCSTLTIEIPERRYSRRSDVSIVNVEHYFTP